MKTATRRVIRKPDGKLAVVFVDTKTGRILLNLRGYRVIGQGNRLPVGLGDKQPSQEEKQALKDAEEFLDDTTGRMDIEGTSVTTGEPTKLGLVDSLKSVTKTVTSPEETPSFKTPTETREIGVREDTKSEEPSLTRTTLTEEPTSTPTEVTKDQEVTQPSYNPDTDLEDRPRQLSNVTYDLEGKHRPNKPNETLTVAMQDVATDVLGPGFTVNVYSGEEDEGEQYGSIRHGTGLAADINITDPNGQLVSDQAMMKDFAQAMAARYNANIGFGPEYMGPTNMHVDMVDVSKLGPGYGQQWGTIGKSWADDLGFAREWGSMPESYYNRALENGIPTPYGPDDPQANPDDMTPVGADATVSFNRFSDDERNMMARTLAGEIDQRFTDLTTEEGRKEAFGILSTMENRANKYGDILSAIEAEDQYSTWNSPKQAAVANENYAKSKATFDSLVDDYMRNPANNLGYTSYYNPSIADPSWGTKMQNTADIGPHRFGSLPEYASNEEFGNYMSNTKENSFSSLDTETDNLSGTSGVGVSASTSISADDISTPNRDWGGMVSAENASGSPQDGIGTFGGVSASAEGEASVGGSVDAATSVGFGSTDTGSTSTDTSGGFASDTSSGIGSTTDSGVSSTDTGSTSTDGFGGFTGGMTDTSTDTSSDSESDSSGSGFGGFSGGGGW